RAAENEAGGDGSAGAAARAAGEAVAVPGVACRGPGEIEGGAADRELVRRQLAEKDATGLGEAPRHHRVLSGHVVGQDLRMRRGADTGGLEDVLEADRDAVQRAAIAPGRNLALGRSGLGERRLGAHEKEAVEAMVEPRNARKARFRQLDR